MFVEVARLLCGTPVYSGLSFYKFNNMLKNQFGNEGGELHLVRRAKFIRIIKRCSPHEAMQLSYLAGELVVRLLRGEVRFTFRNQQGMECTANGTLVNYARVFQQSYPDHPENQFVVFYDTLHRMWRAFHVTELLRVEG